MSLWAFQSAVDLVAAIKGKKVGSLELLEAYIERIERLNPGINAIVVTDFEQARKRAAEADAALARGESWGPLHGLPMTIKDNLEVAGFSCSAGAPELKTYRPKRNADVVQRLLDAGAIIFGKTNLPLYGQDIQTYNKVYGQTNNPWDTSRTSGGSSGGAAAAVAAGLTGMEVGNDLAGSIRLPANLCGIYGHKATYGIIPDRGFIPPPPGIFTGDYSIQADIAVNGPLARSPADLDLAMGLLVAPELPDKKAWRIELPEPRKQHLSEYRIGLWLDDPVCPVDTEVGDCLQKAADALAKAGARIADKRPDIHFSQAADVFTALLNGVVSLGLPPKMFKEWMAEEANLPNDPADMKARAQRAALQRHYHWCYKDFERQLMRQKWADFFADFDVLLCPVTPVAAFPHDHGPFHERTITVNGGPRPYADLMAWAGLTNIVFLPSTVAPVGFTSTGLPVGVQIVGPYLEDRTPIHVAKLMADIVGGFIPPKGFE